MGTEITSPGLLTVATDGSTITGDGTPGSPLVATATGMSIGAAVTGGTSGSVLFIGAGSVLAQDNANFFWDDTNNRLGLGTVAPGTTFDIASATTTAGLAMRAGSTTAVSAASTGRLRYNEGTNRFQVSMNGAAYVDLQTGAEFTLDIGDTVGSSTIGSVLFVGAGNVLQQDNANFFWDDTNNRLGIGTAVPGTVLDLASATTTASLAMRAGSTAAVSAAGTGRLRYNEATATFQVSLSGAAYTDLTTAAPFTLDIGDAIGSSTVGAVLFVGAGNVLQQDPTQFFWDNTNNRLGIGNATPATTLDIASVFTFNTTSKVLSVTQSAADPADGTGAVTLRNSLATSLVQVSWLHNNSVLSCAVGHNNASGSESGLYFYVVSNVNSGVLFNGAGGFGAAIYTGDIANGAGMQFWGGTTLGVSAASTGRIRYNQSTQRFEMSMTGAAYLQTAVQAAALTTGSVLFADASNRVAQDNAGFKYTSATRNLMIGADAVTANFTGFPLTVSVGSVDIVSYMWNTNTAGFSAIGFLDNTRAFKGNIGYANSTTPAPFASTLFLQTNGTNFIIIDAVTPTVTQFQFGTTNNTAFLQYANGSSATVSAANTGRFRYNTTGQKFQMSLNGAAYVDLLTTATGITGSGTTNSIPKWTASTTLGDSAIVDDAANIYINSRDLYAALDTGTGTRLLNVGRDSSSATNNQNGFRITANTTGSNFLDSKTFTGQSTVFRVGAGTQAGSAITWLTVDASGQPTFALLATFSSGANISTYTQYAGSAAAVSAASTGRIRYDSTAQRLQGSWNTGAYADFKFTTTEYLSADGAAAPDVETSFVSGTGTDLTLANGTRGGFIKNFVITGGTGTITPTTLADGDVLTWSATPANVSFIWDATNVTWHVLGNPYNMVTT